MKFTRIITFSIISALSVGALVGVTEAKKAPVDQSFEIKDIQGDRQVLKDTSFESIMKVDTNKFETVTLTKDNVKLKETKYDTLHGVGEKVLNNKDVYRGMNGAVEYENDKFLVVAQFNRVFPYGSDEPFVNVVKKDKKTGKVIKEKVQVPTIKTNQHINHEIVVESNNKLYYAIILQSISNQPKSILKVFELNNDINQLREVYSEDVTMSGDYTDTSRLVESNGILYTVLSSQEKIQLVQLDLKTNKLSKQPLSFHSKNSTYVNSFNIDNDYLYISSDATTYIVDKTTYKVVNKKEIKPSFADKYEYIMASNTERKDNTLYVLYDAYKNNVGERLLVVYDIQSGAVRYEGKLPNMSDRGVGIDFNFAEVSTK